MGSVTKGRWEREQCRCCGGMGFHRYGYRRCAECRGTGRAMYYIVEKAA